MNTDRIQIHLNSKFATKFNNNHYSDVDFVLPVIEAQSQHTIYISVLHAVIPYSFYNINSTNNVLYFYEHTSDPPVTTILNIPFGNYNANNSPHISLITFLELLVVIIVLLTSLYLQILLMISKY